MDEWKATNFGNVSSTIHANPWYLPANWKTRSQGGEALSSQWRGCLQAEGGSQVTERQPMEWGAGRLWDLRRSWWGCAPTERWAPNSSGSRFSLEMPSQDPVPRRPTANFGKSISLAVDQMRRPRPMALSKPRWGLSHLGLSWNMVHKTGFPCLEPSQHPKHNRQRPLCT